MFCQKCGKEYAGGVCPNCGYNPVPPQAAVNNANPRNVRCPKCGSTNLQIVSNVKGEGAKLWKICLCGLFGLCGAGKTTTVHYWVCHNCGKKFKL